MEIITENGLVRIISFQSREVLKELDEQGVYYADADKARERRDYTKDIEQLEGHNPIWGFGFRERHGKSFRYTEMLERFRCEMSLNKSTLADFTCLELFVPKELVKVGITHNSCDFALVIPKITSDMVHRIYYLDIIELDLGNGYRFRTPKVTGVVNYNQSKEATFQVGFRTLALEEYDLAQDLIPEEFPLLSAEGLRNAIYIKDCYGQR